MMFFNVGLATTEVFPQLYIKVKKEGQGMKVEGCTQMEDGGRRVLNELKGKRLVYARRMNYK